MKEPLFDENLEPFEGQKPYGMPLYEYIARTRDPDLDQLRSYWQSVYDRMGLTPQSKTELRNDFRSDRNENCLGALFELFLYELFDAEGCNVTGPKRTGSFNPDFFVHAPNGYSVHVEATCVMCDYDSGVETKRRQRVVDAINSLPSNGLRLAVTITGRSDGDPRVKRVTERTEQWIRSLHYPEASAGQLRIDLTGISSLVFHEVGLKVELEPIFLDLSPQARRGELAMLQSISLAHLVVTERFLKNKLRDKSKQIRKGSIPVILAINLLESSVSEAEILNVLFGQAEYKPSIQDGKLEVNVDSRGGGGKWSASGHAVNTKIVALMLFTNVGFDATPSTKPRLILNPFAVERVAFPSFPWLDTLEPDPKGDKLIPTADNNLNGHHWHESWPLPRNLVVYPLANGRQAETPDGT